MKNKKLLLGIGIGALVLILAGGLVASNSGLFQGKIRKQLNAPSTTPTVDLKINGVDGPITVIGDWADWAENPPATLSWKSKNATSCKVSGTAVGSWYGDKPLNGQVEVSPFVEMPGESTTWSLTCTNAFGGVASDSATIFYDPERPVINFSVNGDNHIYNTPVGTDVVLSWNTENAVSCKGQAYHYNNPIKIKGWAGGSKPLNGIEEFRVTDTVSFLLTCWNANESRSMEQVRIGIN